ncbi:MFS general substrate transporter [Ganoderma leucocontextum]|nr:MFS general substrate transporter [Ganoderma leucocontextum]
MMLAAESPPAVFASTEEPSAPYPGSLKVLVETVLVEEVVVPEDYPPDGGPRAWLVVFGVTCSMCGMIGILTSWGTWQAYYQEDVLRNQSSSNIAWIGSVQSAMGYAPGLIVGRWFDMGYLKLPVFASSVLFVGCMFLTAECTQYWQFLLCQGFGIGIAGGVFYSVGSMVLTHWFKRRLGLALAIAYGGTSVGGCIFPIVAKALLQRTSFPWTMRILGFITLGFVALTNITVARRLPGTQDLGPAINVAEFKKPAYSFYVASLVINNLALMTVLTYITVSAVGAGVDVSLSYDLVAIVNAMSAFGQLGGGLLADRYDPLNVLIGATLMTAVVTYAWPFATNVATFVVVAVFTGISTGGYYSAMIQPFERMGRLEDVGLRIGMAFTLITAGVVAGPPLSGAIFDATGSYKNVGYCGGSMLLVSAALMVVARQFMVRTKGVCGTP